MAEEGNTGMADTTDPARSEALRAEQERQDQVEQDMRADEFVVVAPYVTIKVKDANGAAVIRGFNEGGGFARDDVDEASLRHHLDTGLVAVKGSDRARYAAPAGSPKPGEPPNVPVTEQPVAALPLEERIRRQAEAADAPDESGRPKDYASKPEWVEYAVSKRPEGVSEEDARAEAEARPKADLIAEHG